MLPSVTKVLYPGEVSLYVDIRPLNVTLSPGFIWFAHCNHPLLLHLEVL